MGFRGRGCRCRRRSLPGGILRFPFFLFLFPMLSGRGLRRRRLGAFLPQNEVINLSNGGLEHHRNGRGNQHSHRSPQFAASQQREHDPQRVNVHRVALHLGRNHIALDLLDHHYKNGNLDGLTQPSGNQCENGFDDPCRQ